MSYIIVLTAMVLGMAGVIFTRRNQFNLLTPISQALIWLIFFVGIAGIVDIAYREDAIRQANRQVEHVETRLRSLAQKSFDLARQPAAAKFVVEVEETGDPQQIANFSGPFPSYGRNGRLGRIGVALPNMFAAHAEIFAEPDGKIRFTQTDAEGRALREGEAGSWFRPTAALPRAHGSELRTQLPLSRVLAALKAHGQTPLGALDLDIPNNPQTRTYVSVGFERVVAAFRFYVRQETPYEPCVAVITVPIRFEITPPQSEARMQLTLHAVERETLAVDCGKVPF